MKTETFHSASALQPSGQEGEPGDPHYLICCGLAFLILLALIFAFRGAVRKRSRPEADEGKQFDES
jgi:hypothetical protein